MDTHNDHESVMKVERLAIGSIYLERETEQIEYIEQPDIHVLSISTFEDSKYFHSNCTTDPQNSFNIGGHEVYIKRTLSEGWLYKKGSGFDLLLSQRWKKRWAQLVILQDEPQVPCLLIFWNRVTDKPSTVIPLTGAVVIGHNHEESTEQPHTLTIIPDGGITRTFAVPKKERDEWIHVVNVIIKDFQRKITNMATEARD